MAALSQTLDRSRPPQRPNTCYGRLMVVINDCAVEINDLTKATRRQLDGCDSCVRLELSHVTQEMTRDATFIKLREIDVNKLAMNPATQRTALSRRWALVFMKQLSHYAKSAPVINDLPCTAILFSVGRNGTRS